MRQLRMDFSQGFGYRDFTITENRDNYHSSWNADDPEAIGSSRDIDFGGVEEEMVGSHFLHFATFLPRQMGDEIQCAHPVMFEISMQRGRKLDVLGVAGTEQNSFRIEVRCHALGQKHDDI